VEISGMAAAPSVIDLNGSQLIVSGDRPVQAHAASLFDRFEISELRMSLRDGHVLRVDGNRFERIKVRSSGLAANKRGPVTSFETAHVVPLSRTEDEDVFRNRRLYINEK
jgi:hypothetical protein